MKPGNETAAVCGLFCGTCPCYPQQCGGCLSDHVASDCKDCSNGFRECANSHGVIRCYECGEFPCDRLEAFSGKHFVNGIGHHACVINDLSKMSKMGVDAWVSQQTRIHSCPVCHRLIPWYEHTCQVDHGGPTNAAVPFCRIIVDADGCPVVNECIAVAKHFAVECILLCDTSHQFTRDGAQTLTVSKGPDSVDFALVNLIKRDDVVITQDYGLAAMCLARNVRILNQDGLEYTNENIDGLLMMRHTAKNARINGQRIKSKGKSKRTREQDSAFITALTNLLSMKANPGRG